MTELKCCKCDRGKGFSQVGDRHNRLSSAKTCAEKLAARELICQFAFDDVFGADTTKERREENE